MPKFLDKLLKISSIEDIDKVIPEPIFIPVSDGYMKPYAKRWTDRSYLGTVERLQQNKCLTSELINALSNMRSHADVAETPAELKGINKCIAELKQLLTISSKAAYHIELLKTSEDIMGANNAPSR